MLGDVSLNQRGQRVASAEQKSKRAGYTNVLANSLRQLLVCTPARAKTLEWHRMSSHWNEHEQGVYHFRLLGSSGMSGMARAARNTHRGAQTHDHKVKSLALYRLS